MVKILSVVGFILSMMLVLLALSVALGYVAVDSLYDLLDGLGKTVSYLWDKLGVLGMWVFDVVIKPLGDILNGLWSTLLEKIGGLK